MNGTPRLNGSTKFHWAPIAGSTFHYDPVYDGISDNNGGQVRFAPTGRFSQTRPPRVAEHCGQVNADCFLLSPQRSGRAQSFFIFDRIYPATRGAPIAGLPLYYRRTSSFHYDTQAIISVVSADTMVQYFCKERIVRYDSLLPWRAQ